MNFQLNYNFVLSISFLSFFLIWVGGSREYHNVLYSLNWICLVGFLVMMSLNPHGFFELYGPTFQHIGNALVPGLGNMVTESVFYFGAITFHAIPVAVFRNTYSLGPALLPMMLYLIVFGPYLERIYPLETWIIIWIGIFGVLGIELLRQVGR